MRPHLRTQLCEVDLASSIYSDAAISWTRRWVRGLSRLGGILIGTVPFQSYAGILSVRLCASPVVGRRSV